MAIVRVRANCCVFGLEVGDEADVDNGGEVGLLIAAGLLSSLGAPPGNSLPERADDLYAQPELLAPSAAGEPL